MITGVVGTQTDGPFPGDSDFQAHGSPGGKLEGIGEKIFDDLFDALAVADQSFRYVWCHMNVVFKTTLCHHRCVPRKIAHRLKDRS